MSAPAGEIAAERLVFVSLERWDEHWRRNQFFVRELVALGWQVLFVEPPADLSAGLRRRDMSQFRFRPAWSPEGMPGVLVVRPRKWVPKTLRWARPVNDARRWACVRAGMRAAWGNSATAAETCLWINDQTAAGLLDRGPWTRTLYDITDDWSQLKDREGWVEQIRQDDARLRREADVTVCCSEGLIRTKAEGSRNCVLVRNGVDEEHFAGTDGLASAEPLAALSADHRPVLGYTGTVHPGRLDVDLVAAVAKKLDAAGRGSLVFVGPNHLGEGDRRRLNHPRIRFFGPQSYADLPRWIAGFDACVVPHVVDAFTDSLDPIKLWEYLAVGKPIVATPVAGFRELAVKEGLVTLAADAGAWAAAVAGLPADDRTTQAARRAKAAGHGWGARATVLDRLLRGMEHATPQRAAGVGAAP